jgi:hypothetical protein
LYRLILLPSPQPRTGAFGGAEVEAPGDPGHGQYRFGSQAAREGQLGRVAFASQRQVRFGPTDPVQFFGDGAFGFGFGAEVLEVASVVLAQLVFKLREQGG